MGGASHDTHELKLLLAISADRAGRARFTSCIGRCGGGWRVLFTFILAFRAGYGVASVEDTDFVFLSGRFDKVRQSVTEQSKSKKHGPITSSDQQTVPTKVRACDSSMLFAFALQCNTLTRFVISEYEFRS